MIDFHCHLDLYPDPHGIARMCGERGLYVLSVTTTPSAWAGTAALAREYPRIRTALGFHPQLAHLRKGELVLFEHLIDQTLYVGEVGLDGGPELKPYWADQITVFNKTLEVSQEAGGRVISIHSRRAATAVLDALERRPRVGTPILHWFSGTVKELDRAIGAGCWFSVGPGMLRGAKGRQLASRMPADRVLIESDGPFAQVEERAALPWEAAFAIADLANIWSVSLAEAETCLTANLKRIGELARSYVR